ncbi:MAG: AIR synthase-related protein, partial [Acidobacteriota bacterium]
LPSNVDVVIKQGSWPVLPIFELLQRIGNVPHDDMLRTFNLGIGMVVIVSAEHAQLVRDEIASVGETHYTIGHVIEGRGVVQMV